MYTQEIFRIYENNPNRKVGMFHEFYSQAKEVEHAYDKLTGITGKPPFKDVYEYLSKFLQPFANQDDIPRVWNNNIATWGI